MKIIVNLTKVVVGFLESHCPLAAKGGPYLRK
jgi:hypothetical protein